MSFLFWLVALLIVVCSAVNNAFDENAKDAYYEWFGLTRSTFSKEELASKYRKLARQYHPDKNKERGAEEIFYKIGKAFDVLNDDGKRSRYDRGGAKAVDDQSGGGDHHAFAHDIFKKMFDGMFDMEDIFGGGSGGRRRGQPMQAELGVELTDLYTGRTVSFEYTRSKVCTHCNGSGGDSPNDVHHCKKCNGRGRRLIVQQIMPGFVQQMEIPCDGCEGRGSTIKKKCRHCKGERVHSAQEKIDVEISPGTKDGEVFRFSGMSHEQPEVEAGDLIVVIRAHDHPVFQRDGIHLYTDVHLSLRQALLGFKIPLKQLDGANLDISRLTVTQPGFVERIEGAGMPRKGYATKKGDLFIKYHVIFPPTLKKDLRTTLDKALPSEAILRDEL